VLANIDNINKYKNNVNHVNDILAHCTINIYSSSSSNTPAINETQIAQDSKYRCLERHSSRFFVSAERVKALKKGVSFEAGADALLDRISREGNVGDRIPGEGYVL